VGRYAWRGAPSHCERKEEPTHVNIFDREGGKRGVEQGGMLAELSLAEVRAEVGSPRLEGEEKRDNTTEGLI